MYRVLIVDDEIRIREVLKEYCNVYGYESEEASDGEDALEIVRAHSFDCIILDIMMPNMDGYSTLKKIREFSNIPVIMLSARAEEEDKLYGFELGIDDYVSKPFSPKELMARIKVVIERNKPIRNSLECKGIEINQDAHTLKVNGEIVHVTNKEFEMLIYFLNNRNTVISRDTLLERIWGIDSDSQDRTVDTHVKMLRKNLGEYGDYIVTVRGVGYRFEEN